MKSILLLCERGCEIVYDLPKLPLLVDFNQEEEMMKEVLNQLQRMETKFLEWAEAYSYSILRVGIGIVYTLFGALKFLPNHSPAEQLAVDTIGELSVGLLTGNAALLSLAMLETGLGLCLIFHYRLRLAVYLAVGHMLGTFLPFFLFPKQAFIGFPLSLSLLGQYILKNTVIVGALLVLYAKSARRQAKVIKMAVSREPVNSDREQAGGIMPERRTTVRDTAKICEVGVSTVQRVKKLLVETGEVHRGR